jgi:hypothetical protein
MFRSARRCAGHRTPARGPFDEAEAALLPRSSARSAVRAMPRRHAALRTPLLRRRHVSLPNPPTSRAAGRPARIRSQPGRRGTVEANPSRPTGHGLRPARPASRALPVSSRSRRGAAPAGPDSHGGLGARCRRGRAGGGFDNVSLIRSWGCRGSRWVTGCLSIPCRAAPEHASLYAGNPRDAPLRHGWPVGPRARCRRSGGRHARPRWSGSRCRRTPHEIRTWPGRAERHNMNLLTDGTGLVLERRD